MAKKGICTPVLLSILNSVMHWRWNVFSGCPLFSVEQVVISELVEREILNV